MKVQYEKYVYNEITKGVLDKIEKGDLIKCNEWKSPLRVIGVSENYFIMSRKAFGSFIYSICHKNPSPFQRNYIRIGLPFIGDDNYYALINYTSESEVKQSLDVLEGISKNIKYDDGSIFENVSGYDISPRRAVSLMSISIKQRNRK
ncbi:hypothetical protein LJC02_01780 [Breznakia sp. OttesenSCG-928-G09]|nr:hypothetical protein [Breznakia sp. OttesenSCG-928-G09]